MELELWHRGVFIFLFPMLWQIFVAFSGMVVDPGALPVLLKN